MIRKRHFRNPLWLLLLIAWGVLVLAGCRTTAELEPAPAKNASVPDEARLRTRIQNLNAAIGAKDANAWYAITFHSHTRSEYTLEKFKEDFGLDEAWANAPKKKIHVELEKICKCEAAPTSADQPKIFVCMLLVHGTADNTRNLDLWAYIDNEWYWILSAEGDTCDFGNPVK